jgi:hypothetical protein
MAFRRDGKNTQKSCPYLRSTNGKGEANDSKMDDKRQWITKEGENSENALM